MSILSQIVLLLAIQSSAPGQSEANLTQTLPRLCHLHLVLPHLCDCWVRQHAQSLRILPPTSTPLCKDLFQGLKPAFALMRSQIHLRPLHLLSARVMLPLYLNVMPSLISSTCVLDHHRLAGLGSKFHRSASSTEDCMFDGFHPDVCQHGPICLLLGPSPPFQKMCLASFIRSVDASTLPWWMHRVEPNLLSTFSKVASPSWYPVSRNRAAAIQP